MDLMKGVEKLRIKRTSFVFITKEQLQTGHKIMERVI